MQEQPGSAQADDGARRDRVRAFAGERQTGERDHLRLALDQRILADLQAVAGLLHTRARETVSGPPDGPCGARKDAEARRDEVSGVLAPIGLRLSAAAAGPDPTAGPLDPPALAAMVDRALSDDLAWRYQTADELRDALVEVL